MSLFSQKLSRGLGREGGTEGGGRSTAEGLRS